MTRWKYGQKAHLESSLKVLKLWDEDNPPNLIEIEEIQSNGGYGLRLKFETAGVPIDLWKEKQERLGRFFAKGLFAEIKTINSESINLFLSPITENAKDTSNKNGSS